VLGEEMFEVAEETYIDETGE